MKCGSGMCPRNFGDVHVQVLLKLVMQPEQEHISAV